MSSVQFSIQPVSDDSGKSNAVASTSRATFNARGMIAMFTAAFVTAGAMLSPAPIPAAADMVPEVAARNAEGSAVTHEPLPYTFGEPLALIPSVDAPRPSARAVRSNAVVQRAHNTIVSSTPSKSASSQAMRRKNDDSGKIATVREMRLELARSQGITIPKFAAPAFPAVKTNPYNKYGVYLTASSAARDQFLNETMDNLLASGGSTFVLDVKGYWVYYSSDAPLAKEIGMISPTIDLPTILAKAKERGIYTIARYIAVKDEGLVERKPNWQLRHQQKNYFVNTGWVDPANEEALEYNRQILCELAAMPNLDEINLDYIRMTSHMPYSTGYTGDEKAERLMAYIRMAREAIDTCGPSVQLGVSTYAILGWNFPDNRETIGQDVVQYAPYVDVISPMAYQQTFSVNGYYAPGKHPVSRPYWLVYRTLTGYAALLGDNAYKLRPWLQAYSISKKDVIDEMNAVVDAGYCGFTFWNANNNFGPVYQAMQDWRQPERCYSQTVSVGEPKHGPML